MYIQPLFVRIISNTHNDNQDDNERYSKHGIKGYMLKVDANI